MTPGVLDKSTLPLYQIDNFTNQRYKGNPAAVVPLEQWLTDDTMLAIAAENNLAETAFFVKQDDIYHIRWFTPTTEVDLCGHATLASAYVIHHYLDDKSDILKFTCMAGELQVGFKQEERKSGKEEEKEDEQWLELDFPARPPQAMSIDSNIEKALGVKALQMAAARDLIVELASEQEVLACSPDFQALKNNDHFAVVITAPADDPELDFVSRFFAPKQGIDEDPVTGSSFCSLAPFWHSKLNNKNKLNAYQASQRGGHVKLELQAERVKIAGQAVPYLQGQIFL